MKSTILNIKKRVLVVEMPRISNYQVSEHYLRVQLENGDSELIYGKYDIICGGSDLSEDKLIELDIIETKPYGSPPFFCTLDYTRKGKNKDGFNPGNCAPNGRQFTDSFISAIESNGFTWNSENPYTQKPYEGADDYEVWKEFESKNFHPEQVILFEIL